MRKIEYLGKTLNTIFDKEYTQEEIQFVRDNYYQGDREKAIKQLNKVVSGKGTMTNHVYNYWFERIANDTVLSLKGSKNWSINQFLANDECIQAFMDKSECERNPKVFKEGDIISNFKTAIRLGGNGVVVKPTQFPIKSIDMLLQRYLPDGGVYYDPCAGWGIRAIGAMRNPNTHYIALDLNEELVNKLNDMIDSCDTRNKMLTQHVYHGDCTASGLNGNQADFIFTSPPYFDLEQYEEGKQVYNELTYTEWKELFIKPMVEDMFRVAKPGAIVSINIKNQDENKLYDDFFVEMSKHGEFVEELDLKNITRANMNNNDEKIMVFRKGNL